MNDIKKQIEDIREINRQHKLVIFVGAGVSKNSGICSWYNLVKEMALKINYNDICQKCTMKSLVCSDCGENLELCSFDNYNCQYKYNFSSDEFLKIPQYFYEEKGKEEYINFIKEKFCNNYETNEIDEIIVELEPEHIITTNYDHLIEDVKNPSVSDYSIIKSDNDLLSKNTNRKYIIKMHGDIDDIENIVLKEDDYLNYSYKHELIETYIKSLLIDKTFLFVGYSLSDNNLKLILSYINYAAERLKTKRFKHYLVTDEIFNEERTLKYWASKNINLVNLSNISDFMKSKTPCNIGVKGKPLYSFLKYLKYDNLPFNDIKTGGAKESLLRTLNQFEPFNAISYTTFLSVCKFKCKPELEGGILNIRDQSDYNIFYNILSSTDETSLKIKEYFIKSGINRIKHNNIYYPFCNPSEIKSKMLDLSISWDYENLEKQASSMDDSLEKAYYYSLLYKTKNDLCINLLHTIETENNKKDFKALNITDKYQMAVLEFNLISIRLLNFEMDTEVRWNRLNRLLESASNQSKAFEYIKNIYNNNGDTLNQLNTLLSHHEEYYMKKSTIAKLGGTIYGDLLKLQTIAYDYYYFYKRNYLMLDWFNNVSKICKPYIKAILCTYYPDDYQYSNNNFMRTNVKQYPLTLIDIDIIIRHMKYNDFCTWISYYKVFQLKLIDELDIAKIFDDFCTTMVKYWLDEYTNFINNFGKILSLLVFTKDECHTILNSYIKLITSDDNVSIGMLKNCLCALWLFLDKHYYEDDELNYTILDLLVNKDFLIEPNIIDDYIRIIHTLYQCSDEKLYKRCCYIIENCDSDRNKAIYSYAFIDILLKFDENKWKHRIKENISNNSDNEIFFYLDKEIIKFDDCISKEIEHRLKNTKTQKGVYSYPNKRANLINMMVILILIGIIPDLNDVEYLKEYCGESDYLEFLFNPNAFDYSKINIADYMWCNIINSSNYREIVLKHKSDFWNKEEEKRIELGFGGNFENRVAYKYMFE